MLYLLMKSFKCEKSVLVQKLWFSYSWFLFLFFHFFLQMTKREIKACIKFKFYVPHIWSDLVFVYDPLL